MGSEEGSIHGLYAFRTALLDYHEQKKLSWARIAKMPKFKFVSAPALRRISMGIDPGNKVRKQLGLPPACTVIVVGGGEIPPGAQVIQADQCQCGQWFISNHPRRKLCFVCSPYKGRK